MSEKHNDINALAHRQRILAALARPKAVAGRPVTPPAAAETATPVAEEVKTPVDTLAAAPVAPPAASEALPGPPAGHTAEPPRPAPLRPLAASALALPMLGGLSQRARPDQLLGIFLASRASHKSRRTTLQGLERCARLLGENVDRVPWHDLRVEHTTAIRAALIQAGYRKASIDTTLTALRGVLRYAERLGFMPFEDYRRAIQLETISGEAPLAGRALSREEIGKLRDYCASETGDYGRFLETAFALLLGVGMRVTEACTMPIAGWSSGERVVRFRRKRRKDVAMPVDRRSAACLDAWVPIRERWRGRVPTDAFLIRVHRNDWVRAATAQMNDGTLEYALGVVAAAAGVARFTPHDLRRTFCTMMLDAGKDVFTVAELMSHDDPKTTRRYDRRGEQARAEAREEVEIW